MPLLVIGLNHQSASLELRERIVFSPEAMVPALKQLVSETYADEAAVLSTCNRTELYLMADQPLLPQDILAWLADFHHLDSEELATTCYIHESETAVSHMMKVACGLDSLVLGEPQILGQMKSSYAVAQEADALGSELHGIFQKVFTAAKRVRTDTAIGQNPVSVAYAAVSLAQRIFSDLSQDTAMLIGAGETIDLVARHLKEKHVHKMIFANRTLERAQRLADEFSAQAILLADIPKHLAKTDIVISSTASQLPILGKGAVESAIKQRKRKPIFMVDIAVPRDIEAEVGNLGDVYLYTVDDLKDVIDENKQSREAAAEEASIIVGECLAEFVKERRARHSVEAIKFYRQHAEQLRDEVLKKALRDLDKGVAAEIVVQQLATSLTNKLLHMPTTQLKRAGETGQYELLELSQQLLGLSQRR
ncbi:MAG: glutamyl-tRNA reductase [Pseudomonadota bacterium]